MSTRQRDHLEKICRSTVPAFADPWRFRERRWYLPAPSDLRGNRMTTCRYRRCGVWVEVPIKAELLGEATPERSCLDDLLRRKSATMARYRNAGVCTQIELATIEALWFEGLSLRALARRDTVTPSAIGTRIVSLARKAPEFCRWWRLKHASRSNRHRSE